jgi:hypothetical protein
VSPYLKLTTLGIPLGGQPVKYRQLAHQVGVRIEDPTANSMATFKFASDVLPEGTTFIFGSWACVANGAGYFRRYIVGTMATTMPVASGGHDDLANSFRKQSIQDSFDGVAKEIVSDTTPDWIIVTRFESLSFVANSPVFLSQPVQLETTASREVLGIW